MIKKRRTLLASVLISIFLIFIAVTIWRYSVKSPDEVKLHPEICRMMGYLNIDKCRITELSDADKIKKIDISSEALSQEEIDKYVADQLDLDQSFKADPSIKQVKVNDCVNFSMQKFEGDKKIFSSDDEYLCIDEKDESVVAKALIGSMKGDTLEASENFEGCDYRYVMTVKNIGKMVTPELSDDYVKQHLNADSVSDYLKNLEESLNNDNESASILRAQNDVLEDYIGKCKFDLDKEQVTEYSKSIVNSYVNEAYLYNKDLKTYYTEDLHMSEKQFFDNCYKEGEDYIKKILVVGAVAEKEKYSVDEAELLSAFKLEKHPSDEAYTYMEYQFLTSDVTAPYIIKQ